MKNSRGNLKIDQMLLFSSIIATNSNINLSSTLKQLFKKKKNNQDVKMVHTSKYNVKFYK